MDETSVTEYTSELVAVSFSVARYLAHPNWDLYVDLESSKS